MDQKTSILINSQVPDFVKEEYPLFITFLEAYYEFLENKQGIQLNDLLTESKKVSKIFDVDLSIEDFKIHFFNTFANLLPLETNVDDAFLIKNILPLYKSKGSERSFYLLFKLLFGVDAKISYPKDNVLIASDGKWQVDSSLKISTDIASFYVGNGIDNEFTILKCKCPITNEVLYRKLNVYIDEVLQNEETDYYVLKEYYKIIFNSTPANNSNIRIEYQNVDTSLLVNRKFIGKISGASAISESIQSRILNNKIVYEIFVNNKSVVGDFKVGEDILTTVFVDDVLVNVELKSISELNSITILNPGKGYEVGDSVIIYSPDSEISPRAFISKVSTGGIKYITVKDGGAGFQLGNDVYVNGFGFPLVDASISSLTTNSIYPLFTPNTYTIFSELIDEIDIANTTIDAIDYGFSSNANSNSVILNVLTQDATFTDIGQILGIDVVKVNLTITSEPEIISEPAKLVVSNTEISILDFGSLGKLGIVSSGENYNIGDELIFTNQEGSWGSGASAEITEIGNNGEILKVEFVPNKISGTANIESNSVIVTGTSTYFENELYANNIIRINGEIRSVVEISSNTALNVNTAFTSTANNKSIRLFGTNLIGGQGYTQDLLPTVTIDSLTGSNGNVIVTAIMGSGDLYETEYENTAYGAIEEIAITNYGKSIITIPEIDLTQSGDGTAIASPKLVSTFETYPGRWINDDGIISSYSIRLQDRDYYNKYTYVISSIIEFSKYKDIVRKLLHPVGTKLYAEINRQETINILYVDIDSEISQEPI